MPGPTDTEFCDRADMEDTKIGQGPKDDPDDVAAQGFQALVEGKDHVVAGATRNELMAGASTVSPDAAAAKQMGKMTEPGSGT
jgi:short-subunit dehydrogenase